MDAMARLAFAPNALQVPEDVYTYLQKQRRGFDTERTGEDPRIHERILNIQGALLTQLMHENVAKRIIDSSAYGNTYSYNEVLADLTKAITEGDGEEINSFRQQLQINYIERLIKIVEDADYPRLAQGVALFELNKVRKKFAGMGETNPAHAQLILFKIEKALEK